MSNFEGLQKGGRTFRPQSHADDRAGVGKTVAGLWPGDSPVTVFEKADSPILATDPAPNAGHRGERELGVSVDRIDRDGGAKYVDPASVIRQSIAQLSGVSGSSTNEAIQRLSALADQLEGKSVSGFVHKSEPSLEDVKKQLANQVAILTERIRGLIARGVSTSGTGNSDRFVHKSTAEKELAKALANGRPAPFANADTRSESEKTGGSGRKFNPRA